MRCVQLCGNVDAFIRRTALVFLFAYSSFGCQFGRTQVVDDQIGRIHRNQDQVCRQFSKRSLQDYVMHLYLLVIHTELCRNAIKVRSIRLQRQTWLKQSEKYSSSFNPSLLDSFYSNLPATRDHNVTLQYCRNRIAAIFCFLHLSITSCTKWQCCLSSIEIPC